MRPDADRDRPSTTNLPPGLGARLGRALALLAASTLVSCGGSDGGPGSTGPERDPPGSLVVTTSTVAGGLDEDGFRVALDGGEERSIAPDDTVTFEDVTAGDHAVEIVGLAAECSVSGQNPRNVTAAADESARVTFEARCGLRDRIVFYSDRDKGDEIYVMDADGSNQTRLTENDVINEQDPDVSPDGSYIVFGTTSGIWVMEADGSDRTPLTDEFVVGDPVWSPDGSKIAFADGGNGTYGIYVIEADGSNRTPLIEDGVSVVKPAWSPDGSKIAFASDRDGNREIYVMDSDGSNSTRLTEDEAHDDSPVWSPDGSHIAFESDRDGENEIYVVCSNGSSPPERLTENFSREEAPAWSPDGSKIAFNSGLQEQEIYVMGSDGSDPTNVTQKAGDDSSPTWSPQTATGPGPAPDPSGDCQVAAP